MILNLTQHTATADQVAAGVQNLTTSEWQAVKSLLTFDSPPADGREIVARARDIALIAATALGGDDGDIHPEKAMIGGAPWLMPSLELALIEHGIMPVYAFSQRKAVEKIVDGVSVKTSEFVHVGFITPPSVEGEDAWIDQA